MGGKKRSHDRPVVARRTSGWPQEEKKEGKGEKPLPCLLGKKRWGEEKGVPTSPCEQWKKVPRYGGGGKGRGDQTLLALSWISFQKRRKKKKTGNGDFVRGLDALDGGGRENLLEKGGGRGHDAAPLRFSKRGRGEKKNINRCRSRAEKRRRGVKREKEKKNSRRGKREKSKSSSPTQRAGTRFEGGKRGRERKSEERQGRFIPKYFSPRWRGGKKGERKK